MMMAAEVRESPALMASRIRIFLIFCSRVHFLNNIGLARASMSGSHSPQRLQ
jgi:hypothetical protein